MWQNGGKGSYLLTYCVVFEEKVAPLILDKTQEGKDEDDVALGWEIKRHGIWQTLHRDRSF